MAGKNARRIAGLSNGGCNWLNRIVEIDPVGEFTRTIRFLSRRSVSIRSAFGVSSQSISPRCSALAEVCGSGRIAHSTRSKCAIFGPALPDAAPSGRGT